MLPPPGFLIWWQNMSCVWDWTRTSDHLPPAVLELWAHVPHAWFTSMHWYYIILETGSHWLAWHLLCRSGCPWIQRITFVTVSWVLRLEMTAPMPHLQFFCFYIYFFPWDTISLSNSPSCPWNSLCRTGWSWTHRDLPPRFWVLISEPTLSGIPSVFLSVPVYWQWYCPSKDARPWVVLYLWPLILFSCTKAALEDNKYKICISTPTLPACSTQGWWRPFLRGCRS